MASPQSVYRAVVRELNRAASISAPATRSKTIAENFRAIIESGSQNDAQRFDHDLANAVTFMRSQRMYKILLERYNPLHDMSTEERVKATARRVGLDMPVRENGDTDQ
ncbi:uncharacterized protein B0H18DRAFT_967219 [Fomitopsis serialis]|uniref:uncharacterized protein n=1 Tax=Fomitopsis serialis TaxID=139415 RepID=UPI0020089875|nr:uncharacterized protein B0H18DRAFT_967219 [Neoantrodia serialis]KAH9938444.1 hypothetical protein B0H18DRAFT_967219 [Neoantrodia serialis]